MSRRKDWIEEAYITCGYYSGVLEDLYLPAISVEGGLELAQRWRLDPVTLCGERLSYLWGYPGPNSYCQRPIFMANILKKEMELVEKMMPLRKQYLEEHQRELDRLNTGVEPEPSVLAGAPPSLVVRREWIAGAYITLNAEKKTLYFHLPTTPALTLAPIWRLDPVELCGWPLVEYWGSPFTADKFRYNVVFIDDDEALRRVKREVAIIERMMPHRARYLEMTRLSKEVRQ